MSEPTGHVEPYRRRIDGELRTIRNRWRLVVNLREESGKRSREYRYFDGGKREAQAALDEWLVGLRRTGRTAAPITGTLGGWLDEWLRVYVEPKGRDGELAWSTVTGYQGIVRRYLKPELGDTPLKALRAEQVTALYNHMGTPKAEGGCGLSARTRELTHVVLRASLGKALELGRVRVNVLEKGRGVDRPKIRQRDVTALESDEVVALLESVRSGDPDARRLYLPAFLALVTGMRRGEVLALGWPDVKLPDAGSRSGVVTVRRAWDKGAAEGLPVERYRLKAPKNGKERYVDVGSEVVAVLRAAKADHAARKLAAGSKWCTKATTSTGALVEWGELVICDEWGMPWWPDSFSKAWGTYCAGQGVRCRFHDLRATSGSLALEGGSDPEVVRQRLGHHNAAFFLTKYAKAMHRAREQDAGIMDRLAARLVTGSTGTDGAHR
jgi:integrase